MLMLDLGTVYRLTSKKIEIDFFSHRHRVGDSPPTRAVSVQATLAYSKPAALRGLNIAFGLKFTTLSGVRSTPGTRGRGAPFP